MKRMYLLYDKQFSGQMEHADWLVFGRDFTAQIRGWTELKIESYGRRCEEKKITPSSQTIPR